MLAGAAALLGIEIAGALSVAALGIAPVAADRPPGALEAKVLGMALRAAVEHSAAGDRPAPAAPSAEDLADAAEIYTELCERCHGRVGRESTLGRAFYPPAPHLPGHASSYGESELRWIIEHGIRNTGMPAWRGLLSDEDIRKVAALVKRFDRPPPSPRGEGRAGG